MLLRTRSDDLDITQAERVGHLSYGDCLLFDTVETREVHLRITDG